MNEQETQEEVLNMETPLEQTEQHEEAKITKKKKKEDKEKDELIKANLDLKEKVLRITAEMQNMRKRYELDLSNAYKYDGMDLIEKVLSIIDNFERALNIKSEGNEKFLDGFKMIYNNLVEILVAKGVTEIEALNKEFNPNCMNAVMTEINNDVQEGTVLEVLQKGYMYNDRIIRSAMVKVSERTNEEK